MLPAEGSKYSSPCVKNSRSSRSRRRNDKMREIAEYQPEMRGIPQGRERQKVKKYDFRGDKQRKNRFFSGVISYLCKHKKKISWNR